MMEDQRLDTTPPEPTGPKRLHRSSSQKMFLGICGGLGEYFDIDPTVVRLLFAVGVLLGGSTVVLYIVLALIMPSEQAVDLDPRTAAQQTMDEATGELRRGIDTVSTKVREMFGR
jgi:phage shock protein PspC (stress-responsive transcriptional regulator)